MSEGSFIRVETNSEGDQVVSRSPVKADHVGEDPKDARPQITAFVNTKPTVRIQNDGSGQVVVERGGPSGFQTLQPAVSSDAVLSTGRNAWGMPVDAGQIYGDTILDHPAIGGSGHVKALVAAGLLVQDADGAYRYVGAGEASAPNAGEQDGEPKKEEEQSKEVNPDLVSASPEVEAAIADAHAKAGSETLEAAFTAATSGDGNKLDTVIEKMAEASGIEKDAMWSRAEKTFDSLAAQAQQASGLSADEFQSAAAWARETHPAKVAAADQALFLTGSVKAFRELAQAWKSAGAPAASSQASETDAEVMGAPSAASLTIEDLRAATFGPGMSFNEYPDGSVTITTPMGTVSLAEAVKRNWLRVS